MQDNVNKVSQGTIIRTVLLVVALVNQVLLMLGYDVIPVSDEQIAELLGTAFTIVMAIINWWKNNSFTRAAIAADTYMNSLKRGE